MEAFSIIGLLGAIAAILFGQHLEGGQVTALFNLPAFIIVVGGTFGAVVLETPKNIFKRALTMIRWVFYPPRTSKDHLIDALVKWSKISRKEGFLGLENVANAQQDEFIKKGLFLIIDGHDPKMLREVLIQEIEQKENQDIRAANVYQSMGGYSPTIGILGAVLGLIQVLGNLNEPEKLGAGIAVAFVATIYGVAFANLLYLPTSKRLTHLVEQNANNKELIVEGLCGIARGENPRLIEARCKSFLESP